MSEEDTTKAETEQVVEQREEPKTVDPARAAADAAAKDYKTIPSPDKGFTEEQLDEINKLVESASSKAVNDYRQKIEAEMKEKQQKGDFMTREQFDEALAQERERSQIAVQAEKTFLSELANLGIAPNSAEYEKIAATYAELEGAGAITPKALTTEMGVKSLAYAAGVLETESQSTQPSYIDLTHHGRFEGMDPKDVPDYARADLEVDKAINEALRGQGLA